jgi:hypothetical protein
MPASEISNQNLSRQDWAVVTAAFKSAFDPRRRDGAAAGGKTLLRDYLATSWRRRRPADEFTPRLHELGFTDTQISALAVLAII